jgi:hypothetical protein
MTAPEKFPDPALERAFQRSVVPSSGLLEATAQEHPRIIILAGQPGAGKTGLKEAALGEFSRNAVTIDPDDNRSFHPDAKPLQQEKPYKWADDTHDFASKSANRTQALAIEGRKNIVLDTTLGKSSKVFDLVKQLPSAYEVEIRVVATHRLESELGVDQRFSGSLDRNGFGRYVPEDLRAQVYKDLPHNLDAIRNGTSIPIRIFDREGAQLYDSRTDARQPGEVLRQAREARVSHPEATKALSRGYEKQTQWHEHLPQALEQHPKIDPPTARNLLAERQALHVEQDLRTLTRQATELDQAVRVQPTLGKVARIGTVGSTVFTLYDAADAGQKAVHLAGQGNTTGVQSEVLHFGSRTVGMFGGAKLGGMVGAAVGMESGPGAVVTGTAGAIVGGFAGAIGGDQLADAIDRARIYTQRGPEGHTWSLDPNQPSQGWTRTENRLDPEASRLNDGFPVYQPQSFSADPALADRLNYQASSVAAELTLAHPSPANPYRIAADQHDTPSALGGDWFRDANTKAWSRTVQIDTSEFGTAQVEVADARKTAALERQSAAIVAHNAEQTPAIVAATYQAAYEQNGWKRYGPVPEAVTNAAKTPATRLDASDGHAYTQGRDGHWTRHGLLGDSAANGNVRDELNRTQQAQRALGGRAAPAEPSSPAPRPQPPARLDHPDHPDHAFYNRTRSLVHQLDQLNGRTPDQRSDQLAAAATVAARAQGLQRIDKIALSDDASMLWAVQRPAGARDAFFDQQCKVSTVQGLNASMEHSGAQWPQAMQQFQQHHEQTQSRQQEQQTQSQANQQATSAAPAVHR